MRHLPRILMAIAALCLLTLFFFPMWRITLVAPQYPNGVTMYIHIDKLGGESKATLQNINILNHYVGMKYIEEESIPELKYFPYIVGAMILLALVTIFPDKWRLYFGWVVVLVILAALGVYDFYLWEYDYGHNLSPTAPIKIPGASFQPPLFGEKMILNFRAMSYPTTGGIFAAVGIAAGFAAAFLKKRQS